MTEKTILAPHIAVQPGVRGGRPFIDGKGIAVHHVARQTRFGISIDEIADDYDLTLAEIHAALSFYFDNRAEIDAWLEEDDREYEEGKAQTPSRLDQRLRTLRRA